MSQKTASSAPTPSRVSGGVPWWLWGILVLIGGSIIASIVTSSIPEDPALIYSDALDGVKKLDGEKVKTNLAKLRGIDGYETKCQLLDGMMHLAEGRPLKAIKLLNAIVDDKEVRSLAMYTLGNSYAKAADRWKAVEILEALLKEEEKNDEARFSLAVLYYQIFAWDESLKHLTVLAENGYQPQNVRQLRSEVYADLGEYQKAVDDLSESIKAKPNDPGNGHKASTLMQLLVKAGDVAPAEEFQKYVDQAVVRNLIEAHRMLKEGDVDGARTMAMEMRKENPLALVANKSLAKVMLAYGTKEKAIEGLALLRMSLNNQRDLELYQSVAALARLAEDEPYAALVQQNVDQLEELNKKFKATLEQTVKTINDPAIRVELCNLALEVGKFDLAMKIIEGLDSYYPDREAEWLGLKGKAMAGLPQLVNTMSASDLEKAAAAAAEARAAAGAPPGSQPPGSQMLEAPLLTAPEEPAKDTATSPEGSSTPAPESKPPAENAPASEAPASDAPANESAPVEADAATSPK